MISLLPRYCSFVPPDSSKLLSIRESLTSTVVSALRVLIYTGYNDAAGVVYKNKHSLLSTKGRTISFGAQRIAVTDVIHVFDTRFSSTFCHQLHRFRAISLNHPIQIVCSEKFNASCTSASNLPSVPSHRPSHRLSVHSPVHWMDAHPPLLPLFLVPSSVRGVREDRNRFMVHKQDNYLRIARYPC